MDGKCDLLIRDGRVIDTHQGLDGQFDIAIRGGRVAALAPRLDAGAAGDAACRVIDARGLIVCPGLIDLHVHVWEVANLGIAPDPHCVRRGATTVFDAGSAGADTFAGFRRFVIDVSATRIRAFLHLSSLGQLSGAVGELTDLRYASVEQAVRMCERHRDRIVGIKIRMTDSLVGDNGREALRRARAVCEATGLPLMLHPNQSPLSLEQLLAQMRPHDILTHCFHRGPTGILAADGRVRVAARRAAARGVLFDVGHGKGSFSFAVAAQAMAQGLLPGTISSDLHRYNLHGPVFDLATTVSKFLLLGWSLPDALDRVTRAPAAAMGMLGQIGTVVPGACADVALLELREEPCELEDATGERRHAPRRLVPVLTVRGGEVFSRDAPTV
jgi:dihydroorotase